MQKKIELSKYINGFRSCSHSTNQFLDSSNRHISAVKADNYWRKVEQGIITYLPNSNASELLSSAKRSIEYDTVSIDGVFKHIPGKHIIELLRNKITGIYPFMGSVKTSKMVFLLADKCRFDSLNTLKTDINSYLDVA